MRQVSRRRTSCSASLRVPRGALGVPRGALGVPREAMREVPRRRTSCIASLRVPRGALGVPREPMREVPRRRASRIAAPSGRCASLVSASVTRRNRSRARANRTCPRSHAKHSAERVHRKDGRSEGDEVKHLPPFRSSCSFSRGEQRSVESRRAVLRRVAHPATVQRATRIRLIASSWCRGAATGSSEDCSEVLGRWDAATRQGWSERSNYMR